MPLATSFLYNESYGILHIFMTIKKCMVPDLWQTRDYPQVGLSAHFMGLFGWGKTNIVQWEKNWCSLLVDTAVKRVGQCCEEQMMPPENKAEELDAAHQALQGHHKLAYQAGKGKPTCPLPHPKWLHQSNIIPCITGI